jgi:hypothetical protein
MRGDIIELFKIVKNLERDSDYIGADLVKLTKTGKNLRGHKYKVDLPRAQRSVRRHGFVFRTAKIWNDLPLNVVEANSVASFERRLDKFWERQPIKWDYTSEYKTTWELHKEG